MSRSNPPNPKQFRNLQQWAEQLYEFFLAQSRVTERNDPQPILLPRRVGGVLERAATDGILLFDSTYNTVIQSINGAWEPLRSGQTSFEMSYTLAYNVNGAAIVSGNNKVPLNVVDTDDAPWAAGDTVNNEVDLIQGTYYIDGFYTLTKVSGGAKNFTTYLALASDLSTPVGTVRGASLHMPAASANDFTTITRYAGTVDVPAGGASYALVCRSDAADVRFGTAHNILGYSNLYGRLAAHLVGLNE